MMYVLIETDGKKWVISKEAVKSVQKQLENGGKDILIELPNGKFITIKSIYISSIIPATHE